MEFSRISNWGKRESYLKGNLSFEFSIGLLTDVTQPTTQQRTSSAIVMLTVPNRKPECEYEVRTTVTLYDEKDGRILKENTEKRSIGENMSYVKFMVDLGSQQEIEKSKSKKLQLQVKVRVDERCQYKTYWDKLTVSYSAS